MRTAAALLAAIVTAVLAATGCSSGSGSRPASSPPATTAAPTTTTPDRETIISCQYAREFADGSAADDRVSARQARALAGRSAVAELREIAARYTGGAAAGSVLDDAHATAATYAIRAWCISHSVAP